jgi:hypothetical protein
MVDHEVFFLDSKGVLKHSATGLSAIRLPANVLCDPEFRLPRRGTAGYVAAVFFDCTTCAAH